MDLAAARGMCGDMSHEPDDDALDLARDLCTRAGMLLEDASAVAILTGHGQREEVLIAIADARTASGNAAALLAAAEALLSA